MNFEQAVDLITEATEDVKRFNMFRIRVKKLGRRLEMNPASVNKYLKELQPVFDADVYANISDDEIESEMADYEKEHDADDIEMEVT